MANSTKKTSIRPFILVAILTAWITSANAQPGFYKIFPQNDYHSTADLLMIDDDYVLITSQYFYRIDPSGRVLVQKELKHEQFSLLECVTRTDDGNLWIGAIAFDNASRSMKVLFKVSPDGKELARIPFPPSNSFENMKLLPSSNNTFFMSYRDRGGSGNAAIRLLLLDDNGQVIWNKQVTDTVNNLYSIKKGPNNSADICYEHKTSLNGEMVNVSATGSITKKAIGLIPPASSQYYTLDFEKEPDGIIFCGVEYKTWPLLTDGLLYKTDNNGNVIWQKTIDIKLSDNFWRIVAVDNGYIILSWSGYTDIGNEDEGDLVLIKTDKQGNQVWTKAFGSAKMDYGRHLLVNDKAIVFAGQSSYPGQTGRPPFICKTNLNGELSSGPPFQTIPGSQLTTIETKSQERGMSLVQSAAGADGSMLNGGNILKKDRDEVFPFVVCNDKTGKELWYKELSAYSAPLKLLKKTRTNEYIAVSEIKEPFLNRYDIYKLNEKGDIIWTAQVPGSSIKDVVATRDGGILLTGAADISFVNYETLIVKIGPSGNVAWTKTIGDLRVWETGRKIIETPEHEFLIVGNMQQEFDLTSSFYVMKINSQGNKLWSKTYPEGTSTDIGFDVTITPDNGYLLAGTSNKHPFADKDLMLIKTDKNGNLAWRKKYDIHLMDEGFQVMNTAAGGFLIAGTTGEQAAGALEKFIYVMETDAAGKIIGTRYIGQKGIQTQQPCMTVISTGDTVLTGTTDDGYGREFLFMTKLEGYAAGGETQNESVTIFPNPSAGASSLIISGTQTGPVTILIYDQYGRMIDHIRRSKNSLSFKEDISIPGLASGVYYVRVIMNGSKSVVKWMVAR